MFQFQVSKFSKKYNFSLKKVGTVLKILSNNGILEITNTFNQKSTIIFNTSSKNVLSYTTVSYTHLRAHETSLHLVCRLLLEKSLSQPSEADTGAPRRVQSRRVFSSRRRHTRCREVSWARRCV